MTILVDMNLSPAWVAALNDAGIEASHWSAVGAATATDADIEGALVTIDSMRTRVRVLPLHKPST
ncbi:MAG: DUF5615 family PIN-like protein [Acidobacteriaceae bacterium]|jgi:predicted nuclease of predicted toxin-antitoxin system|nr:DUF5615 family PIN-like protein [Acidobacteriaceae bacterium]